MFNFTTETVINSSLDSNGTTSKYSAGTDVLGNELFKVTRVNNFKVSNIMNQVVVKKAYSAPVVEVLAITVPSAVDNTIYRLRIDIQLQGLAQSDYARDFVYLGKPMLYEINSGTASSATSIATAFKNLINAQNTQFGNAYITATNIAGALTITAVNEFERFVYSDIATFVPATYNAVESYTRIATGTVGTPGHEGFGNTTWMIKNIRLPSMDATNYFGINQEERPVPGGQYTQYSFRYSVLRDDVTGISAVGQQVTSVTNHVFYVLSTLVTGFESALTTAGLTIIGNPGFEVIFNDSLIAVGDTAQASIVGSPRGTIAWTSATVATATIVSATGVITAVAAGTTVITATDQAGNTATATFTVVA